MVRAHSHEQSFLPNYLPKLHAIQSTVTIFHGIITVSQYRQTAKTLNYDIYSEILHKQIQRRANIWQRTLLARTHRTVHGSARMSQLKDAAFPKHQYFPILRPILRPQTMAMCIYEKMSQSGVLYIKWALYGMEGDLS